MTNYLDTEISKRTLCEMAPRMKLVSSLMPKYVQELEFWQQNARAYGERYVRPRALEIDRKCRQDPRYFDWDLVRQSTPYGLLSMLVPRGVGGGGQRSTAMALVMEELRAVCSGIANIFGANGLGISGILLDMDFYHFDRALADIARRDKRRDPVLFASATTEPEAGSDEEDAGFLRKARLVTEAKPRPGGYLLNGRKVFISNGSVAKYTTVIAPLDKTMRDAPVLSLLPISNARAELLITEMEKERLL